MNKILFKSLLNLSLLFGLTSLSLSAQSTFDDVLTIFENKGCAGTYCHGGGAGGLVLNGNVDETYANLVGISPENMTALEKGNQLVMPGYPERSFLYRKINDHLYADSEMDPTMEGDAMPPSGDPLNNIEKETIRQWIYYGAPKTGKAFNDGVKQAFTDYHTDGGIGPLEAPPAPADGEGFQIHFGSIFLEPGDEVEYLKKYDLGLTEEIEVNRLELVMNDFSHHFILYKYEADGAANVSEGLRGEDNIFESALLSDGSEMVTAWQDNQDFRLPEGTAYKWNAGTVLDLNYHILNYDIAAPLAADMYLNVYTQPAGTAEKEMISDLLIYNNLLLIAPNNPVTYDNDFDWNQNINVWSLSTHTHQYGTDYDLYYEAPNGDELQLFEGMYNTDYTEFTGVYDYAHPPIRFFDNFLKITPEAALRQEASYLNTGSGIVTWGLTTNDEMMLSMIQYTRGDDHQDEMVLNDGISEAYCLDADPIELLSNYDSGVVGNGVTHNIFDPSVAGLGSHVLYVNCCDPSTTTELIIQVLPALDGELSINNNTTGFGNATLSTEWTGDDNVTYQWFKDGAIIEGAIQANYEAEFNGEYMVEIDNGACKTSNTFTVTEATNTSIESLSTIGFNAAPNPFTDQARITFTLKTDSDVLAEVYDLSGKQVAILTDAQLNAGEHSFDFSGKEAGVYFLNLQINDQTYTQKLIKQ